ncbi:MAG TPA: L-threonylcarbamoyladenylate synthase [Holophagaceae bacterium]|nr:L-threonylcarbamoyladenylate synthase [Holophagaceae bacterium]
MILQLHPDDPQERHLARIAELLRKDGVIAYPTDTLYGLGCLASRKRAVDRIAELKGRDAKKPMSLLCADMAMLTRMTRHLDQPAFRLLRHCLPGPYTFLLPASKEVPRWMESKGKAHPVVGLRIPDHAFCRKLAALMGEPIVTTSCNRSGEPPLETAWEIEEELGHALDLVVDCGVPTGQPSTIVDLTGDEPALVREGAGAWPV